MTGMAPFGFAFETSRLCLRPLAAQDQALFCDLYTDAETMRFIGEPLTPERAARSFRKAVAAWADRPLERAFLSVLEKVTQRALGICAIVQFDAHLSRAEVGIMLKSEARSRGLAREGLGGLVKQTFRMFPVAAIWVECSAGNPVVERMVSSIGFERDEGLASGPLAKRIWSIHRTSWRSTATPNRGEDNVEGHQLS
jgi:RimJ/RimL family protein N-acetyltransferase